MDFLFEKYDYVVGIDVGNSGGITIITLVDGKIGKTEILSMPIVKKQVGTKKKPKSKTELDELKVVEIFEKYKDAKVLAGIEFLHSFKNEGSSSSFSFGTSWGLLRGICRAFKFDVQLISPISWKKGYKELENDEIVQLRLESKAKKEIIKQMIEKIGKRAANKESKEIKKEIDKISRTIKSKAKTAARELTAKLIPNLKDEFKQVNSDGKAESALIGYFVWNKFNELAQGIKIKDEADQHSDEE